MPSFKQYKKQMNPLPIGREYKSNADMIMEETWEQDIACTTAYLYDWYVDNSKTKLNNMNPMYDEKKIPISIKFLVNSSQTFSKDAVTYHMQLKPSQECNVEYYDKVFARRYGAKFPCGLYCDIQDSKGRYNRWLVVGEANYNDPQFPTFELLRCNHILQWIYENKKYEMAVVLRSQNSYNSGLWADYKIETIEDQQKFISPLNRVSETIFYNQRMIIDAPVLTEPRAWKVSKINRLSSYGLLNATLKQDRFDDTHDYIELDNHGNVIGMWADYYSDVVAPDKYEVEHSHDLRSQITCSGMNQEIKIGGSYKKLTVDFFSGHNKQEEFETGSWKFETYDNNKELISADNLVKVLQQESPNQIKIKFIGDENYIGNILLATYTSDSGISSSIELGIVTL